MDSMDWIWAGDPPPQCFRCGRYQSDPEGWTWTYLPIEHDEPFLLHKCPDCQAELTRLLEIYETHGPQALRDEVRAANPSKT